MAAYPHLAELAEKHKLLEQKIEEEMARPAIDTLRVSSLKMEKLRLKDQIARLNISRTRH